MSGDLLSVLEEARKLKADEKRQLADLLIHDVEEQREAENSAQATCVIVSQTSGSMSGLDRALLIQLAEDEEFSGY